MAILLQETLNPYHIGQAVRQRRRELGYTQTELAAMTRVSIAWLSAFENGRRGCAFGTVIEILSALGLTLTLNGPAWMQDEQPSPAGQG